MDFLATAKEVTNWIISEPEGIITSFAYTAGIVAAAVGLGYGVKWFEKNANSPFKPSSFFKRTKPSKPEAK